MKCMVCGKKQALIASILSVCPDCIRNRFTEAQPLIEKAHAHTRREFNLPEKPPDDKTGVFCGVCINQCRIPKGEKGYCGLRENQGGRLCQLAGAGSNGLVTWYYDSLPTNCVGGWVCPAGSNSGYPKYSYTEGVEQGYENLAVFYEACTFNCLFCQNWHFRQENFNPATRTADDLAGAVRDNTACICYFGGDPTTQLDHALTASRLAVENAGDRILRICWETNGSMNRSLLEEMARISLETGGCIKFDLKAFDDNIHRSLCGTSNRQTLDNFAWLANYARQRPDPPLLVASTLLVPGYVDAEEVGRIAEFIAALAPDIPYSLLGFFPSFYMNDLPRTSRNHASKAVDAARDAGLTRVRIGNTRLLSDAY